MTILTSRYGSSSRPSPAQEGTLQVLRIAERAVPLSVEESMLRWAMIFAIIALVAAVLGFGGIAATAAGFAKILFYIFVALFLVALVAGLAAGRRVAP